MLCDLLPTALGGRAVNGQAQDDHSTSSSRSVLLSPTEVQSDDEEENNADPKAAAPAAAAQRVPEVSDDSDSEEKADCSPARSCPPAPTCLTRHRVDDAEFNALSQRCRQQAELLEQIRALVSGPAPAIPAPPLITLASSSDVSASLDGATTALAVYNPLHDFELEIILSTHDARGRKYVPGGVTRATRLGTTSQKLGAFSIFPHVLFTDDAGGNEYMVETEKNTTVRCRLIRKSDPANQVSDRQLLAVLNADLEQPPVQTLSVRMSLKFHTCGPDGARLVPNGIGPDKTFERVFSDGHVPARSQLLDPPENVTPSGSNPYIKTMSEGAASFSFKVRNGVTSQMSIPKRSQFVAEVSFTHTRLANFAPATSPPFWIKSKFSCNTEAGAARLDRGVRTAY